MQFRLASSSLHSPGWTGTQNPSTLLLASPLSHSARFIGTCHHTVSNTLPTHWSQTQLCISSDHRSLRFSPLGTKPNLIVLHIFETCFDGGLLGLPQALHPMFVQASLLRTVSKSLSRWDPSESVVSIHLCDKYLLNAVYWQGAVPGQMSEKDRVEQARLCFQIC